MAFVLAAGCASPWLKSRPREPTSEAAAAAIIRVRFEEGWFQKKGARAVGLARLKNADEAFDAERVSNLRSGENLYVLDLIPGRYSPSWASFKSAGREERVDLRRLFASSVTFTVKPGEVVFLGSYRLARRREGMRVQEIKLLRIDRTPAEARRALDAAGKDLAGTLWAQAVAKARTGLGPSELRRPIKDRYKRSPAPQAGPGFLYTDVLGWGEPVQIAGGLEWRHPKDRARAAVVLLKPGMKGYLPLEAYAARLRTLGSPEDSHALGETSFSSRRALSARYTTYDYPEGRLLGSASEVYVTETAAALDPAGLWLVHYRAKREHFDRYYAVFKDFRDRLDIGGRLETIPQGFPSILP